MFKRAWIVLAVCLLVKWTSGPVAAVPPRQSLPSASPRAVLERYCFTCHNEKLKTAGLALDGMDLAQVAERPEVWEKVVRKLRAGMMPPPGLPRPDEAAYFGVRAWLEDELDRASSAKPNPGRTETFHRLNRTEYRNAIRDLLSLDIDAISLLPADDASYGFDNIAGVLKVNQARMEQYLLAARKISRMAVGRAAAPASNTVTVSPQLPQYDRVEGLPFGTRGGTIINHFFPQDGEYVISATLLCVNTRGGDEHCDGAGGFPEPHQLLFLVDGQQVHQFTLPSRPRVEKYTFGTDLSSVSAEDERWQVRVAVKAGPRDVGITFLKEPTVDVVGRAYRLQFMKPFNYDTANRGMQEIAAPFVSKVTISGPLEASGPGDTPSRRAIFRCRPASGLPEASCAQSIFSTLARRAYRRPVTNADVQALLTFYQEGRTEGGFEVGIERALRALLVSPEFLFRIERDPATSLPNTVYRLNDFELASRLSFFLWSSIPDEALLDVAVRGKLKEPAMLEQQVRRMLADSRSAALTSNFAEQWLQLRRLEAVAPNESLFPDFDESLRQAFRKETQLFVESVIAEDRSVIDLLTGNYTFVNARLARHYGIPNVGGSRFRRVTLSADSPRRGLLGQGSILTVTSHGTRTSPVKRGKWVLENILGTPPPAPPADVPPLPEKTGGAKVPSMRDRMTEHRANPVCASCHATIDPVGFALENFDAVGRFRTTDSETYGGIDTSGVLPDGTKFDGPTEFRAALTAHPERFVSTLTEKLLTYALGRGVESYDMPSVRSIVREAGRNDYRFSSLILGIVNSVPFQMRRSGTPSESRSPAQQ